MKNKLFLFSVLLFLTWTVSAQQFTYTPAQPKPGDVITVKYTPPAATDGKEHPVEAAYYANGPDNASVSEDLKLEKTGDSWTGTLTAAPGMSFIYFGFKAGEKMDANNNEGYSILLYDGDKPRQEANLFLSRFYQGMGSRVGVETNLTKAKEAMEKELEAYPESRSKYIASYASIRARDDKDNAASIYQEEIEKLLKAGLKTEEEYAALNSLYEMAKLPEQAKMINDLRKEKFPNGRWQAADLANNAMRERDIEKKKQLVAELTGKIESGDPNFTSYKSNLGYFKSLPARYYISKKDWQGFQKAVAESGIDSKSELASLYNSAAWQMQLDSSELKLAEEFGAKAVQYAEAIRKDAAEPRPGYYTEKQWKESKENTYAQYADTYAMVLYRAGKYKQGYAVAKSAAMDINKGEDAEQNKTYALLASKVLSAKKLIPQLEQFVRSGKSSGEMLTMLKTAYVKKRGSEKGYDAYIDELQRESYLKVLAEMKKAMINEDGPSFALYNLDGKKTDIKDLRGKVVIVDFWATWCGPCIASFPGMQRAKDKFKDNPKVQFVFVDTWESVEDKKKNAADFIAKSNYSFDVWLDTEDTVVEQFKVQGIPTKFVLDPEGRVRFKAVGFDGSEDKLVQELTAMIELAGDSGKKAF